MGQSILLLANVVARELFQSTRAEQALEKAVIGLDNWIYRDFIKIQKRQEIVETRDETGKDGERTVDIVPLHLHSAQ